MKQIAKRGISLMLLCLLLCSLMLTAYGATQGSTYFSAHSVSATPIGNGKIAFEFDIIATHSMTELGAEYIKVYRENSNGTQTLMRTYNQSNTSGLYTTNDNDFGGGITYTGVVGSKYFAIISMYCENATGSEAKIRTTSVVTCVS